MEEDFRISKFFKPLFIERFQGFRCEYPLSGQSVIKSFGFSPLGIAFEHQLTPQFKIVSALSNCVKWKCSLDTSSFVMTVSSAFSATDTRICARFRTFDTSIRAILTTKGTGSSIFASYRFPLPSQSACKDALVASSIIDSVLVGVITAQWNLAMVKELHALAVLQSNNKAIVGLGLANEKGKFGTVIRSVRGKLSFRHAVQISNGQHSLLLRSDGLRLSQIVFLKYLQGNDRRLAVRLIKEKKGNFSVGFSMYF